MPKTRCNILAFCVDQWSSCSLSFHGNPDVKTPNLARLAQEGVSLKRAYCTNPVCMPSRASLATGLTPSQHGCITNGMVLPESVPTLAGALSDKGYRTHSVGKLHLQPFIGKSPHRLKTAPAFSWEDEVLWNTEKIAHLPNPYYGFQTTDYVSGHGFYVQGDYVSWLRKHHGDAEMLYLEERGERVQGKSPECWKLAIPEELHYNHWIADRSVAFLDSLKSEEPFYLWCSFPDPHHPFAACQPYSDMYDPAALHLPATWNLREEICGHLAERRAGVPEFDEQGLRQIMAQTYGMMTHVDACIGRVLAYLKRSGRYENTLIVFTSDHGEYLGSHHLLFKLAWPWEELLRVPFLWKAPGGKPRPEGFAGVTSLLDFVPTVLDYAGIAPSALDRRGNCFNRRSDPVGLPSRSLRALLDRGEMLPPKPALVEFDEDGYPGVMFRMRTLIAGRCKLTIYPRRGEGILSDLEADPNETRNLWNDPAYAKLKAELFAMLLEELAWNSRLDLPRLSGA